MYLTDLVKTKKRKKLSPSESVNSASYIPRRFASRYLTSPLFTSSSVDSCILNVPIVAMHHWLLSEILRYYTPYLRISIISVLNIENIFPWVLK